MKITIEIDDNVNGHGLFKSLKNVQTALKMHADIDVVLIGANEKECTFISINDAIKTFGMLDYAQVSHKRRIETVLRFNESPDMN